MVISILNELLHTKKTISSHHRVGNKSTCSTAKIVSIPQMQRSLLSKIAKQASKINFSN